MGEYSKNEKTCHVNKKTTVSINCTEFGNNRTFILSLCTSRSHSFLRGIATAVAQSI